VDREHVVLFDPEWFFSFRRHVSLCQRVQRVAIRPMIASACAIFFSNAGSYA